MNLAGLAIFALSGVLLGLGIVLPAQGAGVWTVHEGAYVSQAGAALTCEILPAEDMDGHTITWYPNWGVFFLPSGHMNSPVPGDTLCELQDDPSGMTLWEGLFWGQSQTVTIQLVGCDNNDGWLDIQVDGGSIAFSYNAWHGTVTNARLVGSGLTNAVHTVTLRTRPRGGDVRLDYVAGGVGPSPVSPTTWGEIKSLYR